MEDPETGTPEGYEPEDAVEPEPEPDQPENMEDPDGGYTIEDALNRMFDMVESVNERLSAIEQRHQAAEEAVRQAEAVKVARSYTGAPVGKRRFVSRFSEGTWIMEPAQKIIIDGQIVTTKQIDVTFSGGVKDLDEDDPRIPWLLAHEDFGISIWEDPTAMPRHSTVELAVGVRGSEAPAPRTGISAPMQ